MRGFSIAINIGARLLPTLNSAAAGAERRIGLMARRLKVKAAETKLAMREMQMASSPVLGLAAAGGLTIGLSNAIGEGSRVAHEMQMLRNAGLTTKEFSQSLQAAFSTARALPTSTWQDNLKLINETRGAFGSLDHALENLTFNQTFGAQMANMLKIDPSEASHSIATAVQALEIRGSAMNMHLYQREMGLLYKGMIQTGGRFNPDEFKAFSATANIPIKSYSERFLYKIAPSIITELGGGDVAGTQASAFRNQILGRVGVGGKKLTDEWVRLGLVPQVGMGGNLSKTGWTAGSMKGTSLALADPLAWAETVLLPAMQKAGINTANGQAVQLEMSRLFGRETAVRFATMLTDPLQRMRLHKDEKMINGVVGMDQAYKNTLAGDPMAGWGAIKAQAANLGASIFGPGKDGRPSELSTAMVNVAKGINTLATAIESHPWLKKGIGTLLVGAAGVGALKLLGIGLRFAFSPLTGTISLLGRFARAGWTAVRAIAGLRGASAGLRLAQGLGIAGEAAGAAAGGAGIASRVGAAAVGAVASPVGSIVRTLAPAGPAIATMATGWGGMIVEGLGIGIASIGGVLAGITAPVWGIIAGVVATVVGAGIFIKNNWQGIGAFFSTMWGSFMASTAGLRGALAGLAGSLGSLGMALVGAVGRHFAPAIGLMMRLWGGLSSVVGTVGGAVGAALGGIGSGIKGALAWMGNLLGPIAIAKWKAWGSSVGGFIGGVVDKLKGVINWLRGGVDAATRFLNSTGQPGGAKPVVGARPVAGPKIAGKRAAGGPVFGGSLYLVGERGPELFRAPQSGNIIPANDTRDMLAGSGRTASLNDIPYAKHARQGGGNVVPAEVMAQRREAQVTFNASITVNGANDPEATARAVRAEVKRMANGQGYFLSD